MKAAVQAPCTDADEHHGEQSDGEEQHVDAVHAPVIVR